MQQNSHNFYFQEGTKTAERGARANKHVHREILELIEVIYMSGFPVDGAEDEHVSVMFFGDLFRLADHIHPCGDHGNLVNNPLFRRVYTRISDKVVGILLRAKSTGCCTSSRRCSSRLGFFFSGLVLHLSSKKGFSVEASEAGGIYATFFLQVDVGAFVLQGRHDDVPVVMTRPMHEIYFEYNQNDKTFVMPAAAVSASAEKEGPLREKR